MAQRALQSLEKAVANEIRKFADRTEFHWGLISNRSHGSN
jgi:hypothetical protein